MSIYGSDIMFVNRELQIIPTGEAELVHAGDTVVQDVVLRLSTYYGTLFYKPDYGSYLIDYIHDNYTSETDFAVCDEITRRVEAEPRVRSGSVSANIINWDLYSLQVNIVFALTNTDSTYNLVLSVDKQSKEFTYDIAT